jgi:hypothetical protein
MIDLTNPDVPELMQRWGHVYEEVKHINKWDDPLEIMWWCEMSSRCTNLLELGAYAGCSTKAMMLANPELRIHVIDLWEDNNQDEFIQNTLVGGQISPKLTYTKGDTHEQLANTKQFSVPFDGLLVDAGHLYHHVKGDLELALPMVKSGVLVCGHDYRRDNPNDGVNLAVKERFPQHWNPVMSVWCAYSK